MKAHRSRGEGLTVDIEAEREATIVQQEVAGLTIDDQRGEWCPARQIEGVSTRGARNRAGLKHLGMEVGAPDRPRIARRERGLYPGVKSPPGKRGRRFGRDALRIVSKGLAISGVPPKPFPRQHRSIGVMKGVVCHTVAPVGRRGHKDR